MGDNKEWTCDKHGDPIKFYCESHEIAICRPCSLREHRPCRLSDIQVVVKRFRKEVNGKLIQIEDAKQRLSELQEQLKSCQEVTEEHMQSLKNEVIATCDKLIQKDIEKTKREVQMINEEADEKIRQINEERDKQLEDLAAKRRQNTAHLCQKIVIQDAMEMDGEGKERNQ